ncbi:MAG: hypothetical protein E7390_06265 [Ruminococcaceae bacterium]|nr:hypothetical protein [Oscillospiraceae bacterium]
MFYEKRQEKELSKELFKNPTAEYRDAPFWAWNTKLDKDTLLSQIEMFRDMGCGGFHMHPRCGLDTEYLSDAFMQSVRTCVDKAKTEGMQAYLYDEDRYPSGTAGGRVPQEPEFGGVYLLMTPFRREAENKRTYGKEYLVAAYKIELDDDNDLLFYEQTEEEKADFFAYCIPYVHNTFYNGSPYVDMFNPKATERFIELTYSRYKETVGDEYGKTVKTIFTDEPCTSIPGWFFYAYPFSGDHKTDITLHWTHDFPVLYEKLYGEDLLALLPELIWSRADGAPSPVRHRFFDMAAERFASSFHDACGKRCKEDGLLLTGHQNRENTLSQQTGIIIEMMRGLRAFGLPGFDILYNSVELNTAKQAQSVAHQYGREGVMTELYGISSWDFDFRGYKYQGDWQAALGATLRVPHVSLMSLSGEAKRDYPASIAYQSPWYKEFRYITDHFARLNTALVRGTPVVHVAVVHPVETFWMHVGTGKKEENARARIEKLFGDVTEWLLYGLMDFDFIAESLLPSLWDGEKVGSMQYDAILVAGCETLRQTTRDMLESFSQSGGKVIVAGEMPRYTDGYKVADAIPFAEMVELSREGILSALEPYREVDIRTDIRARMHSGKRTEKLLYTLRADGEARWLFFAGTEKMNCVDCDSAADYTVMIKGEYLPVLYDTLTGETHCAAFEWKNGETHIPLSLYSLDSVLLKLEKGGTLPAEVREEPRRPVGETVFKNAVQYRRTEPNVLLLDMCPFRLDGGEIEPMEEILRMNNRCRERIGWPLQTMTQVQPWTIRETHTHSLELFFTVRSAVTLAGTKLCFENADKIVLNGAEVPLKADGWYMDKAIQTVPLPALHAGENTITVHVPISEKTNAEAIYLIGEFDVQLRGSETLLLPKEETIGFGDAAVQGLPFYGGSLQYILPFSMEKDGSAEILCSAYRGAAIKVYIDGEEKGLIVKAPYTLSADGLTKGEHICTLEVLGNRHNTLGALHTINTSVPWCTPYKWRPEPEEFSYSYHTHPFGILKTPVIRLF